MGIKKNQLSRAIEKIIRHYLKHGKYPKFQTITYHLGGWLRRNNLGAPIFKYTPLRRNEESSSQRFNNEMENIHSDLS